MFLGSGDCYYESALNNPTTISRDNLTVNYCKTWCKDSAYGIAAIKDGSICGCTNNINLHSEVSDYRCNSFCSGQSNSKRLCGGFYSGSPYWTIYVLDTDVGEE